MMFFSTQQESNLSGTAGRDVHLPEQAEAIVCKLFADTISPSICYLRKQELNGRGGFSCSGCSAESY